MIPERIKPGDLIGLAAPSSVPERGRYDRIMEGIRKQGFRVKTADNFYKDTYGYLAAEEERAADFHQLVMDDEVKMILFGGGEGGNEVLPLLDYEEIAKHPKIYASFSDGTTILNAIYMKTGLVTYYGQTPSIFENLQAYDREQFQANFVRGGVKRFIPNSTWHGLNPGVGEGILIGGYLLNMALLVNSPYFSVDSREMYVLFLEDNEKFCDPAHVSGLLSHLEQSGFIGQVSGLLFGHYSTEPYPELMARLKRFGKRHGIPVAYCDDFGHGVNHAVLPIGVRAVLDAGLCTLHFL